MRQHFLGNKEGKMKASNHHPDCKMPACGLEGKYCPDCSGFQRNQKEGILSPRCEWCQVEFLAEDLTGDYFDGLYFEFCSDEHKQCFIESHGFEKHGEFYFSGERQLEELAAVEQKEVEDPHEETHAMIHKSSAKQPFEFEVKEFVEAALIMGVRRASEMHVTHDNARKLVEQSIPSMSHRFLGLIAKYSHQNQREVREAFEQSIEHLETHENVHALIRNFLDQRFTCRENWTSGMEFYSENDLPELLEQFLFWWMDNQ
jgi:hypothetical protein